MRILLVEDNADDAYLTQEAFRLLDHPPEFTVCMDGVHALEELDRIVERGEALPDLILMDLNMPRLDGFGLLESLKGQDRFRRVPVLVFSTSAAREDVERSYERYANSYIRKPNLFSEFDRVVHAVQSFWMQTAVLPT